MVVGVVIVVVIVIGIVVSIGLVDKVNKATVFFCWTSGGGEFFGGFFAGIFLKISQLICTELSEQGLLFRATQNESKECNTMNKTDKKLISQWILSQSALKFQNRAHFFNLIKMSPRSAMLLSKVRKVKYLSGFSTDLHQTFRMGLIFLSQLK